jgi:hypothetical protein
MGLMGKYVSTDADLDRDQETHQVGLMSKYDASADGNRTEIVGLRFEVCTIFMQLELLAIALAGRT